MIPYLSIFYFTKNQGLRALVITTKKYSVPRETPEQRVQNINFFSVYQVPAHSYQFNISYIY